MSASECTRSRKFSSCPRICRGALAGFSWYVRDLSRFSVHGSIAAVVVFLLWVYISAVILLYGAEVTAAYAKLRREWHGGRPSPAIVAGAGRGS